nr:MAG TPA: hypothetical protein [Caudoviricetes sp.]
MSKSIFMIQHQHLYYTTYIVIFQMYLSFFLSKVIRFVKMNLL